MTAVRRAQRRVGVDEGRLAPIAVIHGRFQPLHLGHLEYLLAGKSTCEQLVVGITNPDPTLVVFEPTEPRRGSDDANPCTYYERYLMVEAALVANGVPHDAFRIVPFPHGMPDRLFHYAPRDALYLLTIYDDWGEAKLRRFRELDLATHVMWRRDAKVTSGTEIRRALIEGRPWEHLVPSTTVTVVKECGIDRRLRRETP